MTQGTKPLTHEPLRNKAHRNYGIPLLFCKSVLPVRPPPWPITTASHLDGGKQPHLTSHSPICAASSHGKCDCHAEVGTTLFFRYCHSSLPHTEQNSCTGPKAPVIPASNAAHPCTFLGSPSIFLHSRASQFPLWDPCTTTESPSQAHVEITHILIFPPAHSLRSVCILFIGLVVLFLSQRVRRC